MHYSHQSILDPFSGTNRADSPQAAKKAAATHGWDYEDPDMWAMFVAAGPAFGEGKWVEEIGTVDVYRVICAAMGVEPAPNNGSVAAVESVQRNGFGGGKARRPEGGG
mmetsp:Transcript_332/g.993  ORF Transcript_332/g.993 Transcript_332/m.993 type:complete len:108 (+) Transcript_332:575-898(+)